MSARSGRSTDYPDGVDSNPGSGNNFNGRPDWEGLQRSRNGSKGPDDVIVFLHPPPSTSDDLFKIQKTAPVFAFSDPRSSGAIASAYNVTMRIPLVRTSVYNLPCPPELAEVLRIARKAKMPNEIEREFLNLFVTFLGTAFHEISFVDDERVHGQPMPIVQFGVQTINNPTKHEIPPGAKIRFMIPTERDVANFKTSIGNRQLTMIPIEVSPLSVFKSIRASLGFTIRNPSYNLMVTKLSSHKNKNHVAMVKDPSTMLILLIKYTFFASIEMFQNILTGQAGWDTAMGGSGKILGEGLGALMKDGFSVATLFAEQTQTIFPRDSIANRATDRLKDLGPPSYNAGDVDEFGNETATVMQKALQTVLEQVLAPKVEGQVASMFGQRADGRPDTKYYSRNGKVYRPTPSAEGDLSHGIWNASNNYLQSLYLLVKNSDGRATTQTQIRAGGSGSACIKP